MVFLIIRIFILIFLFSYHAIANDNNELIFNNSPKKIENFDIYDLNGKKYNINEFKNRILIINFWATWCPPCIKEIPELIDLQNKSEEKIKVIFITVDSNPKKIIPRFLKKNNFSNFDVFLDTNFSIAKKLNVKVMPTSLILDLEQKEIIRVEGYIDWTEEKILETITNL